MSSCVPVHVEGQLELGGESLVKFKLDAIIIIFDYREFLYSKAL